jgi:predicted nucleic acid-binding protein
MVDTSAIIGLHLAGDAWHEPAKRVMAELERARRPLFATSDIFDETVTLLRRWGGYRSAVRTGEALRSSRVVHLVEVDERARDEAWRRFKEQRTPGLSFTDCTSAAMMGRLGIEEIFAFDSDFGSLGLKTLPGRVQQ